MDNVPKDPAKVAVVVQPGFVLLDVAVPQQVFGRWPDHLAAGRSGGSPYESVLVGPASAGGPLLPMGVEPLDRLDEAGTVIVTGVEEPAVPPDPELVERLRDAYDRGSRMVSICTGAFALAAAGILDGRSATTHWYWAGLLRDRHPLVTVREAELYVEDTGVFTSAGVLAGTDLCLHLLRLDHGQAVANAMARFLVSPPHREGGQAQFIESVPRPDTEGISGVITWILEHLDEPLTLESVSRHSHMSTRTLRRRFRAATGTSVMTWVAAQRVARARVLLETTRLGIDDIAHRCGFGSSESLRVHFTALTRTSPSRYRRTFAD
ncbi:GlxA family transcriptional regulator [Streptomyces lavendofoliae]|uniref:AraC family transcriptional regulator n=1 Tax=Streptomyces lavendofoliae TaxID=67314 RepID=A0A918M6A7_9ACTN|nr:helix-turn-helix domain-containing protein [Streptomyces lavendofoliae]GGU49664.1 AraC family transcriptional regulator [Streptomyces lavendofoliae]